MIEDVQDEFMQCTERKICAVDINGNILMKVRWQ